MSAGSQSVLLRHEGPTARVRVLAPFSVEAPDELAPCVRTVFPSGSEIPNLDLAHALELVQAGIVEMV